MFKILGKSKIQLLYMKPKRWKGECEQWVGQCKANLVIRE